MGSRCVRSANSRPGEAGFVHSPSFPPPRERNCGEIKGAAGVTRLDVQDAGKKGVRRRKKRKLRFRDKRPVEGRISGRWREGDVPSFNKVSTPRNRWLSRGNKREETRGNYLSSAPGVSSLSRGPRQGNRGREGGEGGRVGLKCENKYWRESKKIGKESGMETRPRRGFLCGRIYPLPSPPLPSPRRGKHGPWSRGMYNKNTRKERCFPGIKILYPPRV